MYSLWYLGKKLNAKKPHWSLMEAAGVPGHHFEGELTEGRPRLSRTNCISAQPNCCWEKVLHRKIPASKCIMKDRMRKPPFCSERTDLGNSHQRTLKPFAEGCWEQPDIPRWVLSLEVGQPLLMDVTGSIQHHLMNFSRLLPQNWTLI